jgi:hypothetical protein
MNIRIALLLLAATATTAQAEIFQWKDEQGRTHFGQEVPARYQKAAKPVETGRINTMQPERRKSAAAPEAAPALPPQAPGTAAAPAASIPITDNCEAQMQAYTESQACFERFRIDNGAVRPEAYQECKTVPMPSGCSR